ncbi:MAG: wax ester/triacylglycerol synthase family O-acyltransferase [Actinomycetia bacterium]|nr:wax ester/triacylglycerol synthase family O-acyltransferase [Actinomycetes bacterium]
MSGLDASFYLLEDDNTPLHVASVIVVEGPAPSYGDLVRLIMSKLPQVPRYRQRVRSIPLHLGRPVWIDDPHFQVLYHIRHTALPSPGSNEQLRNLAGRVLGQRLDPSKPLWEIWLVEGLEGGRWALIGKVHHCMVDGVAGMDLITVMFELSPNPEPLPESEPWEPEPEPSGVALLLNTARHSLSQPMSGVNDVLWLARNAGKTRELGGFVAGLTRTLGRFLSPSAASLNGPIGPHRRWCWVQGDLDEVRTIRKAFGGTVNDVVLAAVTNGFRDQLNARGELSADTVVRTAVPVSVRATDEKGHLNNRVSVVFVNLPCGEEDPLQRLALIRAQMDDLKKTRQEMSGKGLSRLTDTAVAPALLALGAWTPVRLRNPIVQTVTTNVPGPPFPLYCLGRQVVEMHPYVPLTGSIRIATAIFSYLGKLNFGLSGDFDGMPDLEILAKGIRAGFDELLDLATKPT